MEILLRAIPLLFVRKYLLHEKHTRFQRKDKAIRLHTPGGN